MSTAITVDVTYDSQDQCGESPTWLADLNRFAWVDIPAHLVHILDVSAGTRQSIDVGVDVGAIAPMAGGGLVAALKGRFAAVHPDGHTSKLAAVEADLADNRMNDGKTDSHGRFWAGTMDYHARPDAGTLYRLNADLTVDTMLTSVTISNGIGWSPDDRLMYYVDSPTQRIDVFDYDADDGTISNRRVLAEVPRDAGLPDGMAIDSDGCLWLALFGGGSVRRYTPDGRVDAVLALPASQITSCAFGGPDLCDLYITSASIGLSSQERGTQPLAGAVFHCRPGATGLPPTLFTAT